MRLQMTHEDGTMDTRAVGNAGSFGSPTCRHRKSEKARRKVGLFGLLGTYRHCGVPLDSSSDVALTTAIFVARKAIDSFPS
jgi:hypothetical protein